MSAILPCAIPLGPLSGNPYFGECPSTPVTTIGSLTNGTFSIPVGATSWSVSVDVSGDSVTVAGVTINPGQSLAVTGYVSVAIPIVAGSGGTAAYAYVQ